MSFSQDDMKQIRAFLFDVDGVLSAEISPQDNEGEPVRTANIKDGFAIRSALTAGFVIGIITGGRQNRVKLRYQNLGVRHYYDNASEKMGCFDNFMAETGISAENILYMGDDIPDYPVLKSVGIAACPADAVPEIKAVCGYVSERRGGKGCVRDVIEMVMRSQGKWFEVNGINSK